MDFEQWFKERTKRFELYLIRAALVFLALLLAGQALQTVPQARRFLNPVERLEGNPFMPPETEAPAFSPQPGAEEEHYLVLKVEQNTEGLLLEVLVNGKVVADFNQTRTIRIPVCDGDLVEIDGDLPEEAVEVVVSMASGGLVAPVGGKRIIYNGLTELVGWVIVDDR